MKQFLLCLIIAGLTVSACSIQRKLRAESSFFCDFSLNKIVQQMQVPELKPHFGDSGEGKSFGKIIKCRRDFDLEYNIEENSNKKFDEKFFLDQLRMQISNKLANSGVYTQSAGFSGNSFHFDYSKADNKGWIEVVGARLEGNRYRLWCVIREQAESKDN